MRRPAMGCVVFRGDGSVAAVAQAWTKRPHHVPQELLARPRDPILRPANAGSSRKRRLLSNEFCSRAGEVEMVYAMKDA